MLKTSNYISMFLEYELLRTRATKIKITIYHVSVGGTLLSVADMTNIGLACSSAARFNIVSVY